VQGVGGIVVGRLDTKLKSNLMGEWVGYGLCESSNRDSCR